ncbi:mitochondrial small ribosomal subunit Rsm22-domain-containing protein [Xylaria intraflava]|nr:mitochondrial small ribosomal subunit Rsm22-domain-containing protein [Xylaria intraflava]
MLSATRAQRPCPKCRRQLLSLLESTFTHAPSDVSVLRFRAVPHPIARSHRIDSRWFSATRSRFQEPEVELPPEAPPEAQPEAQPPKPDDVELVVRRARRTFGDTLPRDYLTDEEYKLYVRLYGPPLRETQPGDVGMPIPTDDIAGEEQADHSTEISQPILSRNPETGQFETISAGGTNEVHSSHPVPSSVGGRDVGIEAGPKDIPFQDLPSQAGLIYINAIAKSQREYNALLKLQKDFEAASLRPPEEKMEEKPQEEFGTEEYEGEEEDRETYITFQERAERAHDYTRIGHWRTNPNTIQLPKAGFVTPITSLLNRTSIKHVKEAAENAFGGPSLPFSVATPPTKRNAEQKPIPLAANYHKMSEIDADAFIATMLPGMYASAMSVLVEVRKRLGSDWMEKLISRGNSDGPRVLDVGGGGAGLAAWEQVLQAEWDLICEKSGKKGHAPPGKKTAVVGSETLRQRVSRFLHNTTFLPRLPDYLHSGDHPDKLEGGEASLPRKQYDIIIASHQLMPIKEGFRRKAMLDNLWEMLSPEGGVLIIMEKGYPRGFEAVADVRARLLDEFIISPNSGPQPELIEPEIRREREPGMIIAPCTNHKACPMYLTPGLTHGRKDFCHFSQRFIRPPFLQKILGATDRNHEDIDYTFITVQRGTLPGTEGIPQPTQGSDAADGAFKGYEHSQEAPNPLSLPRNILPPIKRDSHVTLDLCTPDARIERWTIPKSFSRQAYRDARKAKWGDLWALGAKTRVVRHVRLGKGGVVVNDGGVRAQQAARAGKPRRITLEATTDGIVHASEAGRGSPTRRRTKGGRKSRDTDLLDELEAE